MNFVKIDSSKLTADVTTTAQSLTDILSTPLLGVDYVDMNVESGSIRAMFDGNTPTTSLGLLITGPYRLAADLTKVSLISISGTASVSFQVARI